MKVEVSGIIIAVGNEEIRLTVPEARELLSALRSVLEPAPKSAYRKTFEDQFDLKRTFVLPEKEYGPAADNQRTIDHAQRLTDAQEALKNNWTMTSDQLRLVIDANLPNVYEVDNLT